MKIISGGQTGVDRAALDAAIERGIDYGGAIPKGRLAEDGPIDPHTYPKLFELSSEDYADRTQKNVQDADATLVLTNGAISGGTKMTIEFAQAYGKPHLHIDLTRMANDEAVGKIIDWLDQEKPEVLNVAGPRESGAPGISRKVHDILRMVFLRVTTAPSRRKR